jgi:hypothetical protein
MEVQVRKGVVEKGTGQIKKFLAFFRTLTLNVPRKVARTPSRVKGRYRDIKNVPKHRDMTKWKKNGRLNSMDLAQKCLVLSSR